MLYFLPSSRADNRFVIGPAGMITEIRALARIRLKEKSYFNDREKFYRQIIDSVSLNSPIRRGISFGKPEYHSKGAIAQNLPQKVSIFMGQPLDCIYRKITQQNRAKRIESSWNHGRLPWKAT